jgi:RNA polymerase sigma-70 factor (ECF subfamily)
MPDSPEEMTQLLVRWSDGDRAAFDQLMPAVHAELRRLARRSLARQNPGHTLQTSALVNEAYLKLIDQKGIAWQNRAHFFAVAARAMRFILVDHARRSRYAKRGGGAFKVSLSEAGQLGEQRADELVALDDALTSLAERDERKARVVELRFFSGLSVEETAEVLGVAPITVMREWRTARIWLKDALSSAHTP